MGRKSRAKRERKVREPAFKRARNHRMRDRFCRMSSAECGVHQRPRARQIAAVALRQERSIQNRELLLRAAYLGVAACPSASNVTRTFRRDSSVACTWAIAVSSRAARRQTGRVPTGASGRALDRSNHPETSVVSCTLRRCIEIGEERRKDGDLGVRVDGHVGSLSCSRCLPAAAATRCLLALVPHSPIPDHETDVADFADLGRWISRNGD